MQKISLYFLCCLFLISNTHYVSTSWCCYSKANQAITPTECGKKSVRSHKSASIFSIQTPSKTLKAQRVLGSASQKSSH